MRIAISCTGRTLGDDLDPRFGRTAFFLVVDTTTGDFTVIDNAGRDASGGAGIAAAQSVIERKATAVITGQLGPNALNVLDGAGIAAFYGLPGTAEENLRAYEDRTLVQITASGPSHAGIDSAGQHGGRS